MNGVVADGDINVHEFESVGRNIMDKMIGQSYFSIAFKRKDKAKTLANISSVKVAPERTIDPGLLFQRFLVVSKLGVLSLEDVMKYGLSPFPPALISLNLRTLSRTMQPRLVGKLMKPQEMLNQKLNTTS